MRKPQPTVSLARRAPLREASRAGRFAKRWSLSRPAGRPPLSETAEQRRDKTPPDRKAS